MGLRAVLFDIGDTLWSFPGDRPEYLQKYYDRARPLLGDIEVVPPTEAIVAAFSRRLEEAREVFLRGPDRGTQPSTGSLLREALATLGFETDLDRAEAFAAEVSSVEVELAGLDPPEPDVIGALAELKRRGLRLAAVSNTFMPASALRAVLEVRGLLEFMEEVVSSADLGFRKPHPECFKPALRGLGVEPHEAMFVGDRLNTDIEGALGLGMTAVLTHQYRQEDPDTSPFRPHHLIAHLSDLAALAEGRGGDE